MRLVELLFNLSIYDADKVEVKFKCGCKYVIEVNRKELRRRKVDEVISEKGIPRSKAKVIKYSLVLADLIGARPDMDNCVTDLSCKVCEGHKSLESLVISRDFFNRLLDYDIKEKIYIDPGKIYCEKDLSEIISEVIVENI